MQNGFCHSEESLYALASEKAIDPVNEVIEMGRDAGAMIVFTRDDPPEQFGDAHYYDEFERWGEHDVERTWDAELVKDLDVRKEIHIVVKHTYDAFYRTDLVGYLDTRDR